MLLCAVTACDSSGKKDKEADSGPDGSTDTDTDTDSDTDSDSDTDTGECTDEDDFDPADCPDIQPSDPCVRYVNIEVDTPGDGSSWDDALATVQEGIDLARCGAIVNDTCQVWVAAGTYYVHQGCQTDTVRLRPGVELYGGFDGSESLLEERDIEANLTVLDGHDQADGPSQVFHVVTGSDDALIDGFTISGGRADAEDWDYDNLQNTGGGMLNLESSPTVRSCVFSANFAFCYGAGMHNFAASPTIESCRFTANETDDYYDGWGGGLANRSDSDPTLLGCTFSDNYAADGAGIYSSGGSDATVTDCLFESNTASSSGGGIHNQNESNGSFSGCTFAANEAEWGGGISLLDASPQVADCAFAANIADFGGGLSIDGGSPSIERCVFDQNQAYEGGAVLVFFDDNAAITNSVLTDNTATRGGAILNDNGSAQVTSCTIHGNQATDSGGAIASAFPVGAPVVVNSILWGNTPDEIANLFDATIQVSYSNVQGGYPGDGNIDADPLFLNDATNDLHLAAGSPCIDAADGDLAPATDMDGNPRVDDPDTPDTGQGIPPFADMGAFELQP
jgi:predicted outer membrane repeat protein